VTAYRQAENILAFVAGRFGIRPERLRGKEVARSIARARGAAMALCRELTGMSYPEIGWVFKKHHTTVIEAVKRADSELLAKLRKEMGET
jgi:chromosomal replication initiator protein